MWILRSTTARQGILALAEAAMFDAHTQVQTNLLSKLVLLAGHFNYDHLCIKHVPRHRLYQRKVLDSSRIRIDCANHPTDLLLLRGDPLPSIRVGHPSLCVPRM